MSKFVRKRELFVKILFRNLETLNIYKIEPVWYAPN